MQKLFFLSTLCLAACQPLTHNTQSTTNPNATQPKAARVAKQNAVYSRYTIHNHRYLQQQDGAPVKPVNVAFKEMKPKKEPISRYGNPTQYDVGGHTYQVMKSSTGYKTKGIASWYGTKFHKQRTSSGEPYNMYVMTAAHKTLPLPTYVKVRNLNNGRVAIVKVNDRGPFHENRIIDLSYAAALKLGVFPKGTAPVEIETMLGPTGGTHYYVQAGAFASEYSALQLKEKLRHLTPSPVFIEHYNKRYLVRVGPFAAKAMVNNLKTKLAHNGVLGSFSMLI